MHTPKAMTRSLLPRWLKRRKQRGNLFLILEALALLLPTAQERNHHLLLQQNQLSLTSRVVWRGGFFPSPGRTLAWPITSAKTNYLFAYLCLQDCFPAKNTPSSTKVNNVRIQQCIRCTESDTTWCL